MRKFMAVAVWLVASGLSQSLSAATYVCSTQRAYSLESGELVRDQAESTQLLTWSTVVFDATTGVLKYGRETQDGRPGHWTEERLTVASGAGLVAAHYKHNGTVFSAIYIQPWTEPPQFLWLGGGNVTALTGTCKAYGK
jgi:hypothetical protein